jgi:hypothetical protein
VRPTLAARYPTFSPISEGFRASFRDAGTWDNSGAPHGAELPEDRMPYTGTGVDFP